MATLKDKHPALARGFIDGTNISPLIKASQIQPGRPNFGSPPVEPIARKELWYTAIFSMPTPDVIHDHPKDAGPNCIDIQISFSKTMWAFKYLKPS